MELKEMIKVMEHFANGGEVEFKHKKDDDTNWRLSCPNWDWVNYRYRIKQPKIIIEKWLCQDKQGEYLIRETTNIDGYLTIKKVKLLETYEVEL